MNNLNYTKIIEDINEIKTGSFETNSITKLEEYRHECFNILKKLGSLKKLAFSLNIEEYDNIRTIIKEVKILKKEIVYKIEKLKKINARNIEMNKVLAKKVTLIEDLKFNKENISETEKLEIFENLINSRCTLKDLEYLNYILENLKENKNNEICKSELLVEKNNEYINLLKKEILYVKEKIKIIKEQCKEEVEYKKIDIKLSSEQMHILKDISFNTNYEDYKVPDLIMCLAELLSSKKLNDNLDKINELSNYLIKELVEYMSYKNDYKNELFILLNFLKIRISETEKNSNERIYFKKMYKSFKELSDIYKESSNKEKMNPYFAMIMYFLKDDKNYIYIKELIKRREYVVNLRYENKHIIFYILESYISNFEKMLRDKNGDYVNINYIKEVYMLFLKNKAFKITSKESEMLDTKIKEFKTRAKNSLIKEKRKKAVEDDMKDMQSSNKYDIYNRMTYFNYTNDIPLTDDDLIYEANTVVQNIKNYSSQKEAKNIFVYGNAAYSVEDKNNSYVVTMYAIDYSNYILPNSRLGKYLYNQELIGDKPDSFINNYLRFRDNFNYPVFAYQIEFSNMGDILDFKVYKDYVHVDEVIVGNHDSEKVEKLKRIHNIVASKNSMEILKYDLYNINYNFNNLIINEFVKFLESEKLPYLYYGKITPDYSESEQKIFDLSNEIFKLEKIDSHEVKHILSSQIDKNHYSIYPIPNAKYSLNLLTPFSFQGIENERMLNDLYFNERKFDDLRRLEKLKRKYKEFYIKVSTVINASNDYVDPVDIEKSKGKIRKKYKI